MRLTDRIDIEHAERCMRKAGIEFIHSCRTPVYIYTPPPNLSFSGLVDRSCRCYTSPINPAQSLTEHTAGIVLDKFKKMRHKLKQTKMNKKLIEQIKEMPGVKTVEPCDNRVVVTFEGEKVAVDCMNQEQFDFVLFQECKYKGEEYNNNTDHTYVGLSHFASFDSYFIPFTQYLSDYNLTDQWEKYLIGEAEKRYPVGTKYRGCAVGNGINTVKSSPYWESCCGGIISHRGGGMLYYNGKWATIIPSEQKEIELVCGEIYVAKDNQDDKWLFRFKSFGKDKRQLDYYSLIDFQAKFHTNDWMNIIGRNPVPATTKQKQKLIRAEVKNKYYHELNTSDS